MPSLTLLELERKTGINQKGKLNAATKMTSGGSRLVTSLLRSERRFLCLTSVVAAVGFSAATTGRCFTVRRRWQCRRTGWPNWVHSQ